MKCLFGTYKYLFKRFSFRVRELTAKHIKMKNFIILTIKM